MINSGRLSCRIDDILAARLLNCLNRDDNMAKSRAAAKQALQLREYVMRKAMYIFDFAVLLRTFVFMVFA